MTGIKFDEEKVKRCIEAYHDMHGQYPYLICSELTRKILPSEIKENSFAITSDQIYVTSAIHTPKKLDIDSITVDEKKYIAEDSIHKDYGTWYGAKILIDNKLEFGEVHVG